VAWHVCRQAAHRKTPRRPRSASPPSHDQQPLPRWPGLSRDRLWPWHSQGPVAPEALHRPATPTPTAVSQSLQADRSRPHPPSSRLLGYLSTHDGPCVSVAHVAQRHPAAAGSPLSVVAKAKCRLSEPVRLERDLESPARGRPALLQFVKWRQVRAASTVLRLLPLPPWLSRHKRQAPWQAVRENPSHWATPSTARKPSVGLRATAVVRSGSLGRVVVLTAWLRVPRYPIAASRMPLHVVAKYTGESWCIPITPQRPALSGGL